MLSLACFGDELFYNQLSIAGKEDFRIKVFPNTYAFYCEKGFIADSIVVEIEQPPNCLDYRGFQEVLNIRARYNIRQPIFLLSFLEEFWLNQHIQLQGFLNLDHKSNKFVRLPVSMERLCGEMNNSAYTEMNMSEEFKTILAGENFFRTLKHERINATGGQKKIIEKCLKRYNYKG